MDKALEVIMVAMILVVAAVVVLAMLQSRTGAFGDYTANKTDSSSCSLMQLKYERNVCPTGTENTVGSNIETKADGAGCSWSGGSTNVGPSDVCG